MNLPADPAPAQSPSPASPHPLRLRMPVLIAGIAVIVVGGQWIDTRMRIRALEEELARRLASGDASVTEARALVRQNQETLATLQAKVGALDAQMAEAQSQQGALSVLYQEYSRSRDERLLAEVEQTITIAAQQLQLAGNIEAALIALQGVDSRLAKTAQPQWLPLRKRVEHDIERLKAQPVADVSGMALKLESLIASVDTLPLAFEQRPRVAAQSEKGMPAPTGWRAAWEDFWREARQLVRIERVDRTDPGLLPPDQVFFLRENLKLHLASARIALLSRSGRAYTQDMQQSRMWLEHYFDIHARSVAYALSVVKSLGAVDVAQDLPSLNETLGAVRNFKLAGGREPVRGGH